MMTLPQCLYAGIFTLGMGEIIALIGASCISGYLLKLLFDTFFNKSDKHTEALEMELENLQEKFNAQMVQKQGEATALKVELKAAEQKNFDLQLEYAKALQHIETIKNNVDSTGENLPGTEITTALLESFKKRVVQYEQITAQLNQQLEEKQADCNRLLHEIEINATGFATYKTKAEQAQYQLEQKQIIFQQQLDAKDALIDEQEQKLNDLHQELITISRQLQEQLTKQEQDGEIELKRLKAEIAQLETKLSLAQLPVTEKATIEAFRMEAGQVSAVMEQFKQYLADTVQKTMELEQLLDKNEKLNLVIDQLLTEKNEQQQELIHLEQKLHSLQKQIDEQNIAHYQIENELKQQFAVTQNELNNTVSQLQDELQHSQKEIQMLEAERSKLSEELAQLQQLSNEKEHFLLQMIETLKAFEMRMIPFKKESHTNPKEEIQKESFEEQYR